MPEEKLCIFCKSFRFIPGSPSYSDVTPGYQATMDCSEDHWEIDMLHDNEDIYRSRILTAISCKDFKHIKE